MFNIDFSELNLNRSQFLPIDRDTSLNVDDLNNTFNIIKNQIVPIFHNKFDDLLIKKINLGRVGYWRAGTGDNEVYEKNTVDLAMLQEFRSPNYTEDVYRAPWPKLMQSEIFDNLTNENDPRFRITEALNKLLTYGEYSNYMQWQRSNAGSWIDDALLNFGKNIQTGYAAFFTVALGAAAIEAFTAPAAIPAAALDSGTLAGSTGLLTTEAVVIGSTTEIATLSAAVMPSIYEGAAAITTGALGFAQSEIEKSIDSVLNPRPKPAAAIAATPINEILNTKAPLVLGLGALILLLI